MESKSSGCSEGACGMERSEEWAVFLQPYNHGCSNKVDWQWHWAGDRLDTPSQLNWAPVKIKYQEFWTTYKKSTSHYELANHTRSFKWMMCKLAYPKAVSYQGGTHFCQIQKKNLTSCISKFGESGEVSCVFS